MSSVQVGVLGPVTVRGGNTEVDVGGHKPRALLVALALVGEGGLDRDQLVAEVWPDDPPASATRSLAAYVSRLRQAFESSLGRRLIERDGHRYRLALEDADEVDAEEFVDLLESLPDDAVSADRRRRQALALWRGEVLEGEEAGPVTSTAVNRLVRLRRHARAEVVRGMAADPTTDREDLVAELTALLGDRPEHPWLWELLIDVLRRDGATVETEIVRNLVGMTGQSGELDEPTLPPAPAGGRIVPPLTRFFGRGEEVQRLRDALDSSRFVTVTGPAGAGKTRLAMEVARRPPWGPAALMVNLAGFTGHDIGVAVSSALTTAPGVTNLRIGGRSSLVERLSGVRLLVLDACEHLVDRLGPFCGNLLSELPGIRVLVTSRRRVGIRGEHLVHLHPLDTPDPDGPLEPVHASPAVQFYLDRDLERARVEIPGWDREGPWKRGRDLSPREAVDRIHKVAVRAAEQ